MVEYWSRARWIRQESLCGPEPAAAMHRRHIGREYVFGSLARLEVALAVARARALSSPALGDLSSDR